MIAARHRSRQLASYLQQQRYFVHRLAVQKHGAVPEADLPAGFVFDIDGVLIRGKNVLPPALKAMEMLYSPDKQKPIYPVAFLTNGGGVTEAQKAKQLSDWLGVKVTEQQVVLSHTPFKSFSSQYADKPVVVVGRGRVLDVAHHYGFKHVLSTHHIAAAAPDALPFWPGKDEFLSKPSAPLPFGTVEAPIKAIFIFNDPIDWYMDLQLLSDIITGGGVLGRSHQDVPPGTDNVHVFFSNPDLLWANEHSVARFGQGAFAACLEMLHERLTGEELKAKRIFGKPNPEPYKLIQDILETQAKELGYKLPEKRADEDVSPFSRIFAVGDNPAADVRGANAAGHPWVSVLVRSGVHKGVENCKIDPAHMVVDDVEDAIKAAKHQLRSIRWHSMR